MGNNEPARPVFKQKRNNKQSSGYTQDSDTYEDQETKPGSR